MNALAAQEVMEHLNNRFVRSEEEGEFTITGGYLLVPTLADGQWYWIEGSLFNDGLHRYGVSGNDETSALVGSAVVGKALVGSSGADSESDLVDETFNGRILGLSIPRTFEALVEDMEAWLEAHPASSSGYTSESFGGYSYDLPTTDNGTAVTVYDVFRSRLNKWRRLPCS